MVKRFARCNCRAAAVVRENGSLLRCQLLRLSAGVDNPNRRGLWEMDLHIEVQCERLADGQRLASSQRDSQVTWHLIIHGNERAMRSGCHANLSCREHSRVELDVHVEGLNRAARLHQQRHAEAARVALGSAETNLWRSLTGDTER